MKEEQKKNDYIKMELIKPKQMRKRIRSEKEREKEREKKRQCHFIISNIELWQ